MKSKNLIITLICILPFSVMSQQFNQTKIDSKTNSNILIGYCDLEGLKTGEFGSFFNAEYELYNPEKSFISELKKLNKNINITLVLGTWCDDSKVQVPRFVKILDLMDFDFGKLKIIAFDSDKTAPGISAADLSLRKIPTFIFYRDGVEFGRIVETPFDTLEKDMLKLFSR